jgi:hypothetical protein
VLAPYPLFARPSSVDQVSYSQLFEKKLVESCPFRRLVSFRLVSRRCLSVEGRVLLTLRPTLARPAPPSPTSSPPPPPGFPSAACRALSFPAAPQTRGRVCAQQKPLVVQSRRPLLLWWLLREVGGGRTLANDVLLQRVKGPPPQLASFLLPAKLQPNFRRMGGKKCRCKTHVLLFCSATLLY